MSLNVHLIVGEDDFLVQAAARKILERTVEPALRATAVETVDGAADNRETQLAALAACRASVQTPPFLDPVKLTWWRNVTFLPGGGRNGKISEDVKAALEKFAADLAAHPLPSNQVLVITATKLLKTSIFAKTLKGIAEVIEFASAAKSRDRAEAALMRLGDLAAEEKLTFAEGADRAFVAKAGSDTRLLVSELAKMRTYLGRDGATVTEKDVADITSVGGEEPELWEITDALARRNAAQLVATVRRFDGKDGFGILLATVTEKFYRELVVYREALDRGWLTPYGGWAKNLPPDVARDLDAAGVGPGVNKSSWLVKRAAQNARAYSLVELRIARYRLIQARENFATASDPAAVLGVLLEIIRRRSKG